MLLLFVIVVISLLFVCYLLIYFFIFVWILIFMFFFFFVGEIIVCGAHGARSTKYGRDHGVALPHWAERCNLVGWELLRHIEFDEMSNLAFVQILEVWMFQCLFCRYSFCRLISQHSL